MSTCWSRNLRRGGAQPMTMNYGFDPEAVEALATAFHKSWSFISNDPLFAKRDPKLLQRRLVQYLMQLAAYNGGWDSARTDGPPWRPTSRTPQPCGLPRLMEAGKFSR